jgi:PHD/YefM family antitoxin component YafN of YafNO toxin-antitoxin module
MAAHPQEQYVVDPKGKKTAVILSLKRYRELMEDLHDLAMVAERRNERAISLDEMKRRLKKDGLL